MTTTGYATSLRELAAILGVAQSTLISWRHRGCPLRRGKRGYSIRKVVRWREEHAPARHEPSAEEIAWDERKSEADARYRKARAELVELKLAVESGLYMAAADVSARYRARDSLIRRESGKLVRRLARILPGLSQREMEYTLDQEFRRFCLEMSKK